MHKPQVTFIVCGRFHYHKYIRFLGAWGILQKFICSYKLKYNFGIGNRVLKNYPLKEYLMYAGMRLSGTRFFYTVFLPALHSMWQRQVLQTRPQGNIVHFLVHGNCYKIIHQYKKKGIKVIGEVVNAHPVLQEELLDREYKKHGLRYESGEKTFKEKIVYEMSLCDYLLVPSSFIKESLTRQGIDQDKIKVLPYGLSEIRLKKESSYIKKTQRSGCCASHR